MSIEAITWALSAGSDDAPGLSPTHKLALVGWANHAHKDGRHSWASHATIAEYVGCSTKTISRLVPVLIAGGWIREGDQSQVSHLRADRRPIVYDLAMTEAQRRAWAAEAAGDGPVDEPVDNGERVDSLSPRGQMTGGQPVPSLEGHGWTHGWTHGGTPVSTEPRNLETKNPPTPAERGSQPDATDQATASPSGCPRHPDTIGANCRTCGTTARQLASAAERRAAAQRRADDQARFAADRERRLTAVPLPSDLKAEVRAEIHRRRA